MIHNLRSTIAELLQGRPLDIVCLSDTLWDQMLWTNRQYTVSTLAQLYDRARVLYVETPSFVIHRGTGERKCQTNCLFLSV